MPTVGKPRPTSAIACHKCNYRVALATTERLPDEFTVRCPNCGRRDVYHAKEIRGAGGEPAIRSDQSMARRAS